MTNQSLIGKTRTDIIGMKFIELQFFDYLGNPIEGVQSIVEQQTGTQYTITPQETIHPFGMMSTSTALNAYYSVEGNRLIVHGGQQTGPQTVTEVYKLKLLSLTTSERVYNKFKYRTS